MWKAQIDGRTLHFELAGINNQNFIMRDRETGSWWQQVTGEAIQGPLAGRRLELAAWDEVSFAAWRREHPRSLVLLPEERYAGSYYGPEWEERVRKLPTVVDVDPESGLEPRDIVVGVTLDGRSKAYPLAELVKVSPVVDELGATPLVLVVDRDGKSVRSFDRRVDGEVLDLYLKPEADELLLVDAGTGSEWDFSGTAVSGPLAGRKLSRVRTLKDYWFDWQLHHPETAVLSPGL